LLSFLALGVFLGEKTGGYVGKGGWVLLKGWVN